MIWDDIPLEEQRAWTQVFLDHPPVFLGVLGMLGTQDALRHGRPTTHTVWRNEICAWRQAGFTPHLYMCLRFLVAQARERGELNHLSIRRIFVDGSRELDSLSAQAESDNCANPGCVHTHSRAVPASRLRAEQWSGFITKLDAGVRPSVACKQQLRSLAGGDAPTSHPGA